MKTIELSEKETDDMRRFYLAQYEDALQQLKHLRTILEKLGMNELSTIPAEVIETTEQSVSDPNIEDKPSKPKRKRRRKRGRKSLWGNYIMRQLKKANRPLSYGYIVKKAMYEFNLPEEKEKNVKQAITNSAFRLRAVNGKLNTFGLPGKKERFLCLSKWFENGELLPEYQERIAPSES